MSPIATAVPIVVLSLLVVACASTPPVPSNANSPPGASMQPLPGTANTMADSPEPPPRTDAAATCGTNRLLEVQAPACRACTMENCCAQTQACDLLPACTRVIACYGDCPPFDRGCTDACEQRYPTGLPVLAPWAQCQDAACNAQCMAQ